MRRLPAALGGNGWKIEDNGRQQEERSSGQVFILTIQLIASHGVSFPLLSAMRRRDNELTSNPFQLPGQPLQQENHRILVLAVGFPFVRLLLHLLFTSGLETFARW